jgi:hypothetical protein
MVGSDDGPQGPKVHLPAESFRSVHIEMVFCPSGPHTDTTTGHGCNGMADGSAFIYNLDGRDHLVTARHNLTGRHWQTNACIGGYPVNPTHLRVMLLTNPPEQWQISALNDNPRVGNIQVLLKQYLLALIGDDWGPIWKQHPILGTDMDVAVLPLTAPEDTMIVPWQRKTAQLGPHDVDWPQLTAGQDVFIVG